MSDMDLNLLVAVFAFLVGWFAKGKKKLPPPPDYVIRKP